MRKDLINKYNVINKEVDIYNPLEVGNGDFAYTMDVTGFQTLDDDYTFLPLTAMTSFLWVGKYPKEKIKLESFKDVNTHASYMTLSLGQESLYNKKRENPFRFNIFKLRLYNDNKLVNKSNIHNIYQELNIFDFKVNSKYEINNYKYDIDTQILKSNSLKFNINKAKGELKLFITKPSPKKSGFDGYIHNFKFKNNDIILKYQNIKFYINIDTNLDYEVTSSAISFALKDDSYLILNINHKKIDETSLSDFFLEDDLYFLEDEELNRRMILSKYLLRINCCSKYLPQETGLTASSWFSKFHLEMTPLHLMWTSLYNHDKYLENILPYYHHILKKAKKRAHDQGYKGARWPKMSDPDGNDSPSNIGCLLYWNEPHIIFMLESLYQHNKDLKFLKKHKDLVFETLKFMESFLVYKDGVYNLDKPIIPLQECFRPTEAFNPIFELVQTKEAFKIGILWKERLNIKTNDNYLNIINNLAPLPIIDNLYVTHQDAYNMYQEKNYDHPEPLMVYGLIKSSDVNTNIMNNTVNKILDTFDLKQMWGWDFPVIALTLINLGRIDEAIEILKLDSPKNTYLRCGHNPQLPREDLPSYLPGNGAYLLAYKALYDKLKTKNI